MDTIWVCIQTVLPKPSVRHIFKRLYCIGKSFKTSLGNFWRGTKDQCDGRRPSDHHFYFHAKIELTDMLINKLLQVYGWRKEEWSLEIPENSKLLQLRSKHYTGTTSLSLMSDNSSVRITQRFRQLDRLDNLTVQTTRLWDNSTDGQDNLWRMSSWPPLLIPGRAKIWGAVCQLIVWHFYGMFLPWFIAIRCKP